MSYSDRALEMKDELVTNRRYLHEHAEVGLTLPKTRAFIEEKLREYGIEPQRCGEGVTGLIGKGGKVLLLRADMDVVLAGLLNRIEIWSEEKWNENNNYEEIDMDEIAGQLTELGLDI